MVPKWYGVVCRVDLRFRVGGLALRTRHFRDLIVWQCAMVLARRVYHETASFPKSEMFGLQSQIRRAAVSIPSNIAEGHGRLSDKVFRVFLAQARGSLYELQTQLELAADLGYLPAEAYDKLSSDCTEAARLLNGLLRSMRPMGKLPEG